MKHLSNLDQLWPKYLPLATFPYNIFNVPNLANYSPYELVFGRKPKLLLNLETTPDIKGSGTFKDYYTLLNKSFNIFLCRFLILLVESCSKLEFSVTEHLVEVVDKLSTTAVVFFRSERILKCNCLYGA